MRLRSTLVFGILGFAVLTAKATAQDTVSGSYLLVSCPSVITLTPATCGHFKTGHFGWPET